MDNTPVIPSRVRTVIYVACLILNVSVIAGFGVAQALEWLDDLVIAKLELVAFACINVVCSSLGVAYRPTRLGEKA